MEKYGNFKKRHRKITLRCIFLVIFIQQFTCFFERGTGMVARKVKLCVLVSSAVLLNIYLSIQLTFGNVSVLICR